MATLDDVANGLASETQRNKYLVEFLWRQGDHPSTPADLAANARRLAAACDPNEEARPK